MTETKCPECGNESKYKDDGGKIRCDECDEVLPGPANPTA